MRELSELAKYKKKPEKIYYIREMELSCSKLKKRFPYISGGNFFYMYMYIFRGGNLQSLKNFLEKKICISFTSLEFSSSEFSLSVSSEEIYISSVIIFDIFCSLTTYLYSSKNTSG